MMSLHFLEGGMAPTSRLFETICFDDIGPAVLVCLELHPPCCKLRRKTRRWRGDEDSVPVACNFQVVEYVVCLPDCREDPS